LATCYAYAPLWAGAAQGLVGGSEQTGEHNIPFTEQKLYFLCEVWFAPGFAYWTR